ncbi:MAG: FAD-dependent oxidoreductase, partial [Elusimicrobiota bacterium]
MLEVHIWRILMYEAAVIGAGPAGYKSALKLASAGKKVCLIEKSKDKIGGTCLNSGCIPVKSIIESAIIYEKMKKARSFGITCSPGPPEMSEITGAAIKNISELKKGLNFLLKKSGVDIIYGKASFKNEKELTVEGRPSVRAESIILCTGSAPRVISAFDIDGKNIINSSHLLDIKNLPETILLVGGGYIGLELACAFSSMGSKVTVIERLPRILAHEDPAMTDALKRIM